MASKSKKTRKIKKTPVRIISPQTVEMPVTTSPVARPVESRTEPENAPAAQRQTSTIVKELKRIAIISAVILVLLIILSFIF